MKYTIFGSHTAYCSGWNIDKLYTGTIFKKSARTMRFRFDEQIDMLDWDYRQYLRNPDKVFNRHIDIINSSDVKVAMLPDFFKSSDKQMIQELEKKISRNIRMLIPVHSFEKWLLDYELALPNANWFKANPDVPLEYYDNITHILGGSPHSHIQLVGEFEQVITLDGNQIFNMAIKACKSWQNDFPKWKKIKPTNLEAFKLSIKNVNEVFSNGKKTK